MPFADAAPASRYSIERRVAACVRSLTRIRLGSARCCRRAPTLTASPVTMSSPRAAASCPATTSPVLTPIRRPTSTPWRSRITRASRWKRSRIASAARTARSASSPWASGTPNTASTASPTNFSLRPPNRSTSALTSANSSPWRTRSSSGSMRSPSAVEPARSAKSTVTTRRSSRSSTVRTRAAGVVPRGVPHAAQKAAPAAVSAPHAGQAAVSETPHALQKRTPDGCSAPHEGHLTVIPASLRGQGAVTVPSARTSIPSSRRRWLTRNWKADHAPGWTSTMR